MSMINTKIVSREKREFIYDYMAKENDPTYNLTKAAEELQELSLALLQRVNKGGKVTDKEITDEIGDVKIRIEVLERIFCKESIWQRINKKMLSFQHYINTKKHENI